MQEHNMWQRMKYNIEKNLSALMIRQEKMNYSIGYLFDTGKNFGLHEPKQAHHHDA